MPQAIIGCDVIIKVDDDEVFGQRDAKISGNTNMINMSAKSDFPDPKFIPGWNEPSIVECDCLLSTGAGGGFAYWSNLAQARQRVTLAGELGVGDTFMCQAWLQKPELASPQDSEGTMTLRFQVDGPMIWTSGGA